MVEPGINIPLLLAASTWTAVSCHAAVRYAARGPRLHETGPRWAMLLQLAVGVLVWGANGQLQPVASLQVAGASVAISFAWEVAGVLEYYARKLF